MFLLCAVVLAGACDAQTERISIELQTRLCVSHHHGGVIDSQKQLVFPLPFLITFVRWKLQDFKPVLIGITKVKSFDTTSVLVPVGQTLWTSESMFDFVFTQQRVSLVHVARNDCNMLKPTIIAARINRNRTTLRGQVLSQFDQFVAQLHSDHSHT